MEIYLFHQFINRRLLDNEGGFVADLFLSEKVTTLEDYQVSIFRDKKQPKRVLPVMSRPVYYEYPGHYGKVRGSVTTITVDQLRKLDDYYADYEMKRSSGIWVNSPTRGDFLAQVYVMGEFQPMCNKPPEGYLCPSLLYDFRGEIVEIGRDWKESDDKGFYYDWKKSLYESFESVDKVSSVLDHKVRPKI